MHECKLIKFPIIVGVNLCVDKCPKTREEEEYVSHVPYASVIGEFVVCYRIY
jgi:hypothetical protein